VDPVCPPDEALAVVADGARRVTGRFLQLSENLCQKKNKCNQTYDSVLDPSRVEFDIEFVVV